MKYQASFYMSYSCLDSIGFCSNTKHRFISILFQLDYTFKVGKAFKLDKTKLSKKLLVDWCKSDNLWAYIMYATHKKGSAVKYFQYLQVFPNLALLNRDHPLSAYAKFSEKLTFLTPSYCAFKHAFVVM